MYALKKFTLTRVRFHKVLYTKIKSMYIKYITKCGWKFFVNIFLCMTVVWVFNLIIHFLLKLKYLCSAVKDFKRKGYDIEVPNTIRILIILGVW